MKAMVQILGFSKGLVPLLRLLGV